MGHSFSCQVRARSGPAKILGPTWNGCPGSPPPQPSGDASPGDGNQVPRMGSSRQKGSRTYSGCLNTQASVPPSSAPSQSPPGRSGDSQAVWSEPRWQRQRGRRRRGQRPSSCGTGKRTPSESSSLARTGRALAELPETRDTQSRWKSGRGVFQGRGCSP